MVPLTGCLILGVLGLGAVEAHAAAPSSAAGEMPSSKQQCKKGRWETFGFKNQGDCVSFVATRGKNPPSGPPTASNRAPFLGGIEPGALAYSENDPATAITSALTVTAIGDITGATVTIGTGFAGPEDVHSFVNTSESPSTMTRTVTFQVQAGPRFASNTASRDVTVTAGP
jgi:hypothetical protein